MLLLLLLLHAIPHPTIFADSYTRSLPSSRSLASIRQGAEKRIAARRSTTLKLGDFVGPASKASKWD